MRAATFRLCLFTKFDLASEGLYSERDQNGLRQAIIAIRRKGGVPAYVVVLL